MAQSLGSSYHSISLLSSFSSLPKEVLRKEKIVLQHYCLLRVREVPKHTVEGEPDVCVGAIAEDPLWPMNYRVHAHYIGQRKRLLVGAVHYHQHLRLSATLDCE